MKWEYHKSRGPRVRHEIRDAESDNGDVIAVVDPHEIAEELGRNPERYGAIMAASPEMLLVCKYLAEWDRTRDEDYAAELISKAASHARAAIREVENNCTNPGCDECGVCDSLPDSTLCEYCQDEARAN